MSIARLDGGITESHAGSIFIFIFNSAVAHFAMANELDLMATHII